MLPFLVHPDRPDQVFFLLMFFRPRRRVRSPLWEILGTLLIGTLFTFRMCVIVCKFTICFLFFLFINYLFTV